MESNLRGRALFWFPRCFPSRFCRRGPYRRTCPYTADHAAGFLHLFHRSGAERSRQHSGFAAVGGRRRPGGRYLGRARRGRAVSLYAQNVGGYATATDLFYEVFYPQNTSLQSLEGVMAYIRLPKGKPGDRYSLFHFNLYTIKNNTPAWTNAGM